MRVIASADYRADLARVAGDPARPASQRVRRVLADRLPGADRPRWVGLPSPATRPISATGTRIASSRRAGPANICRLGFTVTRVAFDRAHRTLSHGPTVMATRLSRSAQTVYGAPAVGTSGPIVDPQWCQGLDVDRATGIVYLAVADFVTRPRAGQPHGIVRIGRSADGGRTWSWRTLSPVTLPGTIAAGGGLGSSFKPTVAARDGVVFVGFHVITDRVAGSAASAHPVVGTYYAVSVDGGRTFGTPAPDHERPLARRAPSSAASTGPGCASGPTSPPTGTCSMSTATADGPRSLRRGVGQRRDLRSAHLPGLRVGDRPGERAGPRPASGRRPKMTFFVGRRRASRPHRPRRPGSTRDVRASTGRRGRARAGRRRQRSRTEAFRPDLEGLRGHRHPPRRPVPLRPDRPALAASSASTCSSSSRGS